MKPLDPESTWLFGYEVAGVAGVPEDRPAVVGPLARVNFLVGRNNHGKSTLLKAAQGLATTPRRVVPPGVTRTLVPVQRAQLDALMHRCSVRPNERKDRISKLVPIDGQHVGIWVPTDLVSNPGATLNRSVKVALGIENYSVQYSGEGQSGLPERTVLIPAFRQMRPASNAQADQPSLASGEGLIAELATWQHPRHPGTPAYLEAKSRWGRLVSFGREVLEDPDADIEVADATELHVRLAQAGAMLHIDDLGDGVKQVLMIAAACIYYDDHLVLLEEPEIHLHAGLQRKLMRFLESSTRSQYLIATHSAHVLDLPNASIFHVAHDGVATRVSPAVRASEVQQVCLDLGYMASDLLQANFTVWVEGPSDRIYWRRWLQLVDPQLVEGVHFSVMSYGGYLIDGAHLLDEPDPATEDLVHLLRLGRSCVVIADSDKRSAENPSRPTVVRLQQESELPGSGEFVACSWVRTVENLLPREKFRAAVRELHPRAGQRLTAAKNFSSFDDPFGGLRKGTYSKIAIAKRVAEALVVEDLDAKLFQTVNGIAASIRIANGMSA
jgi:energy-coupling factor transporter ATP-binding protein EcfA2